MRHCGYREPGTWEQCDDWASSHPTLCYWHAKRDAGLLGQEHVKGKPRQGLDPADVCGGERAGIVKGLQRLGATALELRLAARQVRARSPELYAPRWSSRAVRGRLNGGTHERG